MRPLLPDPVTHLKLHGPRVGLATAALRFQRAATGAAVRVLDADGPLDVVMAGNGVSVRRRPRPRQALRDPVT